MNEILPFLVEGSDYKTTCGSSYLKPYSTATCNVTITYYESVVG